MTLNFSVTYCNIPLSSLIPLTWVSFSLFITNLVKSFSCISYKQLYSTILHIILLVHNFTLIFILSFSKYRIEFFRT